MHIENIFKTILNTLTDDLGESLVGETAASPAPACARLRVHLLLLLYNKCNFLWFQNLKEAHLTYSFHCCSFQFPAKHDYATYDFDKVGVSQLSSCWKTFLISCFKNRNLQKSSRTTFFNNIFVLSLCAG